MISCRLLGHSWETPLEFATNRQTTRLLPIYTRCVICGKTKDQPWDLSNITPSLDVVAGQFEAELHP